MKPHWNSREYKREQMRRLRAANPKIGRPKSTERRPPRVLTRATVRTFNSWLSLLPPGIEP